MEATAQADIRTSLIEESNDPYEVFRPIMAACGATCPPKDFYWAVNEALHAVEADVYDSRHASIYIENEYILERLFSYLPEEPPNISHSRCRMRHRADRVFCIEVHTPKSGFYDAARSVRADAGESRRKSRVLALSNRFAARGHLHSRYRGTV